ncbi:MULTISPECIES: FUSC family protein [Peribacillus]|uniref:FUSC family protein n=1 Tax=Peribacillus TaxID=2675229 RepID=UPI001F4ECBA9|nr:MULTISPECIES: FUSC family protein [unclassified Peribacillus]MCK1981230.1 FUSC family protein [Peribacillus sp. Aquil_B1]MCK2007024.1 FUSC family protein [Peribacillus sp. Aquil_B8]
MSENKHRSSSESLKLDTIHTTFKQAFEIKKNPFPWIKALSAGIAAALPVFIGLLFGNLSYGLLAGIGGFTYLYVFNQPYRQRAKKIFFVMVGLALSVILGTLLAPYQLGTAIMMGIIGASVFFVFGALKITGPSAVFFVLSFALATGMPVDQSLAPLRGVLVLMGGALSWIICMLGWFFNPHGPESLAVEKVYIELGAFFDSMGTETFNKARQRTVLAMKHAEDTLLAGVSNRRSKDELKRLYLLNEHANAIFLEALEITLNKKIVMPPELGQSVRALAGSIASGTKNKKMILQPDQMTYEVEELFMMIYDADAIMNEPVHKIDQAATISKPSLKTIFLGAFDKNSIVFLSSVRYGTILTIAAIIAYSADFNRSYWIPLSCAAVMSGPTIIATFHRAVQRTFGTVIGLLIASLILAAVHNEFIIVLIILSLTFITELFIVRNYGLAAMFFTPSALIMAEYSSQSYDFGFFATVRITDIVVGSLIGLLGSLLLGSRSASSLLNHLIAKTIRSQGQLLLMAFSEKDNDLAIDESSERNKMQTNMVNLLTVYNASLGEIFKNKASLESLWPVIFSIEQLGYYLNASLKSSERPILSERELAQLLYVFETMAIAADKSRSLTNKEVPEIEGYSKIRQEILDLQDALQFCGEATG